MNTSYEKLSVYNNFFSGSVEDNKIFSTDIYGHKKLIGYTTECYNETMDLLNIYYDKLVELGAIEKEKTQEDIIREQEEMIKSLVSSVNELKEQVKTIKGDNNGYTSSSKDNIIQVGDE